MTNMLQKKEQPQTDVIVEAGYRTNAGFELVQRIANMFAKSSLVPNTYQGNLPNCVIALEMAQRIGASPLMTMQNMYIVHGRPAWSSQFLISCLNASGRFSPLRYKITGKKGTDSWGCIAWAKDLADGEVLEGPEVTIAMAKAEGWYAKNGSKWKTIPDLMLRYRAATFFARLFAPELTMGIRTQDEVQDIGPQDIEVGAAPYAADIKIEKPDLNDGTDVIPSVQPADTPVLKPIVEMERGEIIAEIKSHSQEKYYVEIAINTLPDECTIDKAPDSMLGEILSDLRETAESRKDGE